MKWYTEMMTIYEYVSVYVSLVYTDLTDVEGDTSEH